MKGRTEKDVFLGALDCATDQEREAYLAAACADHPTLREAVDGLLVAHRSPQWVAGLDADPRVRLSCQLGLAAEILDLHDDPTSGGRAEAQRNGELIGHYRLVERIGEGGFGHVYIAEQQRPVRRRVALKLIKPGMDSSEVIARFQAERQALAMMDHPQIARVFDAGTTATGQPYFVMELVAGIPLTSFCREHRLDLRQRLALFNSICWAVQHAHQKGIIHRDLKPSNVLVSGDARTAMAKVIDFGIAKAMREPLTETTFRTRGNQLIGTPMYMSPEQADWSGMDMDTRSDIYSLGVILYELLAGSTPFDSQRLHRASLDELRQILREEDPPRPSKRLALLSAGECGAEALAGLAGSESTRRSARSLGTLLRGELDWIVMKALDKDRRRRYQTAAELAADVQRFLDDQPVLARPPSKGYRVAKFVRRNKVVLTASLLVLAALVSGTAMSTWQAVRANRARAEAESLRQETWDFAERLREANVLLDSARANADERRWSLALDQYTQATQLQPDHYLTWSGRGLLYARLGAWRAAAHDFARALALGAPANNPGWWGVPQVCVYAGHDAGYRKAFETLDRQWRDSEDPALVTFATRSLCLRPLCRETAHELALRMEDVMRVRGPGPGRGSVSNFSAPITAFLSREIQWYARGLAQYRSGDAAEALQSFRRLDRPWVTPLFRQLAAPARAMAYYETNQVSEAEQTLEYAGHAIDGWIAALDAGEPGRFPLAWFDFLECWLLHREASGRIRGEPPAADARLAEFEQQVLAAIGNL